MNLLKSCDLDNLRPSSTPMEARQNLFSEEEVISDPREYRRVIGSLQYLCLTRPDIQFAVNKLSQFMSSPKPIHLAAMKRVLRFLSGSQGSGITLNRVSDFSITGFCDADWGEITLTERDKLAF